MMARLICLRTGGMGMGGDCGVGVWVEVQAASMMARIICTQWDKWEGWDLWVHQEMTGWVIHALPGRAPKAGHASPSPGRRSRKLGSPETRPRSARCRHLQGGAVQVVGGGNKGLSQQA